MIDRASRDVLAEITRHLVAGRITNDELESRRPESSDPAVSEIYWNGVWGLYDDLHEHRLIGRWYIPRDSRSDIARCILFLKSNLEYEWSPYPPQPKVLTMLLSIVTFGMANRLMVRKWKKQGVSEVWPFFRREDYTKALAHPPYLATETS